MLRIHLDGKLCQKISHRGAAPGPAVGCEPHTPAAARSARCAGFPRGANQLVSLRSTNKPPTFSYLDPPLSWPLCFFLTFSDQSVSPEFFRKTWNFLNGAVGTILSEEKYKNSSSSYLATCTPFTINSQFLRDQPRRVPTQHCKLKSSTNFKFGDRSYITKANLLPF